MPVTSEQSHDIIRNKVNSAAAETAQHNFGGIMCTGICFTDSENNLYFGRNLDWNSAFGERTLIMPKGYELAFSFLDSTPVAHAAIGMGIAYEGYPLFFDCGNDAGLAVAGLNFPGYAQYESAPIPGKTNIAAYEFPEWIAASFATVNEVQEALQNVAIVAQPVSDNLGVSLLHWLISDKTRSIVVEYMADGMHVYDNPVDTLANQPTFGFHLENLRNYLSAEGAFPQPAHWRRAELVPYGSGATMRGIPGDYYSPSRFVKAAFLNAHYPEKGTEPENVARMFHTLGNVSMVEGAAQMADGSYERTLYTSCFSARTGNYYYSTYENPAIRYARLADYATANPNELIEPEEQTS